MSWRHTKMRQYTNYELIKYLLDNGLTLFPMIVASDGNKFPDKEKADPEKGILNGPDMRTKDWTEYLNLSTIDDYAKYLDKYIKRPGHHFAVMPFNDILGVDFDPGHERDGYLSQDAQLKKLMDVLGRTPTLYARKKGSKNIHFFYKASVSINTVDAMKELRVSVDFFSCRHSVRMLPEYYFCNLDIDKPLIDQLADTPKFIVDFVEAKDKELIERAERIKNMQGKIIMDESKGQWMKKTINRWAADGRFDHGTRNDSLFKFALYAMRKNVDEYSVQSFLENFCAECLPTHIQDVRTCVQSAAKYI